MCQDNSNSGIDKDISDQSHDAKRKQLHMTSDEVDIHVVYQCFQVKKHITHISYVYFFSVIKNKHY